MTLHFAFDPGLASLGLAVTRTRPRAGIDILAVSSMIARPLAPGEAHKARMHRRRSRYLARRKARRSALAALLRDSGLLPASRDDSLFAEDPWALRDAAKDRPVAAHALGRLIMHLHARRGAPQGVIDTAGMSTPLVGEMSCSGYRPGRGAAMLRNRAHSLVIEQCLVTRTGVLAELDTILSAQKPHHAALHDTDLADRIRAHFCDAGPSVGKAHRPRPERALDTLRRLLLAAMADLERRFGKPERVTVEAAPFGPQKPASGTSKASLAQRQARAAGGIPFCPYTGTELTKAHLSSRLTETDHIVPLSRGGRNEPSNMVVCLAGANRAKGARTPREAFSHTNGWDGMVAKSGRLPHAVASHFMAPEQDRSEAPEQDALMRRAVELCRTMIARRWPETLLCVQSANAVARSDGNVRRKCCSTRPPPDVSNSDVVSTRASPAARSTMRSSGPVGRPSPGEDYAAPVPLARRS